MPRESPLLWPENCPVIWVHYTKHPPAPPDFGLWWSVSGEYELTYRVQDSS